MFLPHPYHLGDGWKRPGPELYTAALSPDSVVPLRRVAMVQEEPPTIPITELGGDRRWKKGVNSGQWESKHVKALWSEDKR